MTGVALGAHGDFRVGPAEERVGEPTLVDGMVAIGGLRVVRRVAGRLDPIQVERDPDLRPRHDRPDPLGGRSMPPQCAIGDAQGGRPILDARRMPAVGVAREAKTCGSFNVSQRRTRSPSRPAMTPAYSANQAGASGLVQPPRS